MSLMDLTKKQLEEKGEELAGLVIQLEQLQTKNKDKKSKMKAAETDLEVQIGILAVEVKTGKMEVDDQQDAFDDAPKKKRGNLAAVEEPETEEEDQH